MSAADEASLVRFLVQLEQPFDADRDIGIAPTELVRFALGTSDYWANLALGWLASGLATSALADDLRTYAANTQHPQRQRHEALRLLKAV